MDGRTDGWTDGWTDGPSYRDKQWISDGRMDHHTERENGFLMPFNPRSMMKNRRSAVQSAVQEKRYLREEICGLHLKAADFAPPRRAVSVHRAVRDEVSPQRLAPLSTPKPAATAAATEEQQPQPPSHRTSSPPRDDAMDPFNRLVAKSS